MAQSAWARASIRFKGELVRSEGKASMALLPLPKKANAQLPPSSRAVEGIMNGFPFRASLEHDARGSYSLRVNRALQAAAGKGPGDTVAVEITRVDDEPEIRIPDDLRKALEAAPAARAAWDDITPMARRTWILYVTSPKLAETRDRHVEAACDMLASGKRRPCCFPGIQWMTKDHVPADETWLSLPSSKSSKSSKAALKAWDR